MLQRLRGEKRRAVPGHKLCCPRCGLCLEISSSSGQSMISYDFAAWDRLCGAPWLGGPSICLMRQNASAERADRYRDH